MNSPTAEVLEVKVETARQLEERLDAAVRNLQLVAARTRSRGILVTRLDPGIYTGALGSGVPCGVPGVPRRLCPDILPHPRWGGRGPPFAVGSATEPVLQLKGPG